MGETVEITLVQKGGTGIVLWIGAVGVGSGKLDGVLAATAKEHLSLVSWVVIQASDQIVGVLRNAAARIERGAEVDSIEHRGRRGDRCCVVDGTNSYARGRNLPDRRGYP